tara:strand:- start:395 stop:616 length:222 start_codon:yes stop_codon:yes gene_type:complete
MILEKITKGRTENSKGWVKSNVETFNIGTLDLKLEDGTYSAYTIRGLAQKTKDKKVFTNWLINQQVVDYCITR